jgi:hypothetical protein
MLKIGTLLHSRFFSKELFIFSRLEKKSEKKARNLSSVLNVKAMIAGFIQMIRIPL